MDSIRNSIINCLQNSVSENGKLILKLNELIEKEGEEAYSTLIHVLAHLELDPESAKECWKNIVSHRESLSRALEREVNLQTAICDYFCTIDVSLKSPKIVEISVFEKKDKASKFDRLTGLYNRSYFDDCLNREIARAKRYEQELSILFFDLDNFKKVNDVYGHQAGDLVLKNVSETIMQEIRSEDVAARYGGEEMVIILPQTEKIRSLMLGERIREEIEKLQNSYLDKKISITVSGGLASYPMDTDDFQMLIKYADQALYEAKNNGKNNIVVYSKSKRRYLRFDFATEVKIKDMKSLDESCLVNANSKNLSKSGILFESAIPFKIGDLIQLTITLDNKSKNINIIGDVIRVEIFGPDCYEIGVSFMEIDKSSENKITRFMKRHFKKIYL